MPYFQSAAITGASSGIGRALAVALAQPGVVLHLAGRDRARLEETVRLCRSRGAEARPTILNVRDAAAVTDWIASAGPLRLVVANAGIATGAAPDEPEQPEQVRAIFATNLDGALNTVLPAMQHMSRQQADARGVRGHIAAIASIAAFFPSPSAPAYSGSKAALDAWTVATSAYARRDGLLLTSICPGFIRTPMTAGMSVPRFSILEADKAARIILKGVRAGKPRVIFPWWLGIMARMAALLPQNMLRRLR